MTQETGDEPYGDVVIKSGGISICRFWIDDAPEPEFNHRQYATARFLRHACESKIAAVCRELDAKVLRLFDLVRNQRAELHEAGLISDQEYAELASENSSGARLASYDELTAEVQRLKKKVEEP